MRRTLPTRTRSPRLRMVSVSGVSGSNLWHWYRSTYGVCSHSKLRSMLAVMCRRDRPLSLTSPDTGTPTLVATTYLSRAPDACSQFPTHCSESPFP